MKLLALVSAGLIAAIATLPAGATAQEHRERVVTRTTVHTERHDNYRPRRTRQVCSMQNRHHHRVRVCRTVRY